MFSQAILVLAALTLTFGLPTGDLRSAADKNLLVNDILFPEGFDIRAGIVGDQYRWPNRELIYVIDSAFSADERNIIYEAMNQISARTCIRFRERSNQGDFVFIRRGGPNTGCNSYVGKIGGQQVLNLQAPDFPGAGHCIWVGTAAHELIHAIGFFHEQSRTDRDDWVYMNWDNIYSEYHFAFDKYPAGYVDSFGVPYDYASIMHYDQYAFAINPSIPTIYPRVAGSQLGNDKLTDWDAQKINNMYRC